MVKGFIVVLKGMVVMLAAAAIVMASGCGRSSIWVGGDDAIGASTEQCANLIDDDNNGLIDCDDPGCNAASHCAFSTTERCRNGVDDDRDQQIDCADSDCATHPQCQSGSEQCTNTVDDDGDTLVDCLDDECAGQPGCFTSQENCVNGVDDDADNIIDCDDADCQNAPACAAKIELCGNKGDDDGDGFVDCDDPDCLTHPDCKKKGQEVCNNGIDDDEDATVDCLDSDCSALPICQPGNEVCDNLKDDDNDGAIDCSDPDCLTATSCQSKKCQPSIDLGTIAPTGAVVNHSVTTTGTKDVYTSTCAVPGGGEVVAHFKLSDPTDLKVFYKQQSGDHVLALYRAGIDEACNANDRGCFDTQSQAEGSFSLKALPAGDYYLIVEAFAAGLEGQIDVTLSTQVQTVVEQCANGLDDDQDGALDCADLDCATAQVCSTQKCVVDANLGSLVVNGASKSANLNTATASDLNTTICGGGSGKDRVIRFVMPETAGLELSIQQTGWHVFSLHKDDGPGTTCHSAIGSCFDSNQYPSFKLAHNALGKGVYYLIVEALSTGFEGDVTVSLRAYGNRGPELCANHLDDDGDGLIDCIDPDCVGVTGCQGPVCLAQYQAGTLKVDTFPQTITVDTTTANNDQTVPCALGGGKDHVIELTLDSVSMLYIKAKQTGDHVLGLFAAGKLRDPCDKDVTNCADIKQSPFGGEFGFPNLQPGKYYLIVEAFKPGAEGQVTLELAAIADHAQEICTNGVDDDGDGKIDCQDNNCGGHVACQNSGCNVDQALGLLAIGATKNIAANTAGAGNNQTLSCAPNGGEDVVISFTLPQDATLDVNYAQLGDHAIGLFSDKGLGYLCDTAALTCQPTAGQPNGKLTFSNLIAGKYYLIVDATSATNAGSIVLQLSAK